MLIQELFLQISSWPWQPYNNKHKTAHKSIETCDEVCELVAETLQIMI